MILGGGSNCQGCGCGRCPECTRTCQNPHTGAAFQQVYQVWSFGAVNGLATDGYLAFSGDSEAAGLGTMDGDGPFHQQIGGTFNLNSTQTRFPCSLTVSFWRTLYQTTATTDTELTSNTVTITCNTGRFVISPANIVLNAGESYTFSPAVPLVPLLSGDPRSSVGTFGGFATCDNTQVAVSARIDWSNPDRIHGLYGIVRECYEETDPCCTGGKTSEPLYLEVSGYSDTAGLGISASEINGTFVLERDPYICDRWKYDSGYYTATGLLWVVAAAPSSVGFLGLALHGRDMGGMPQKIVSLDTHDSYFPSPEALTNYGLDYTCDTTGTLGTGTFPLYYIKELVGGTTTDGTTPDITVRVYR